MAIVKILPRHSPSYGNLINYILKEGKNEKPQVFTHNLYSDNANQAAKEFLQNESFRTNARSDQVYLYHEIISFSNLDTEKINPEMLEDIGRKYIELRGNEGIYLGAVHHDKSHTHIHFCTSGTKLYTGKAMRLARDDLQQLKVSLQEYHQKKYPEIEKSNPNHGKGNQYLKNKEWYQNKRNEMKTEIEKKVNEILENAKTQKEFLDGLRIYDLHHYERKAGEPTGIVHENSKFRFTSLDMDMEKFKALPLDFREEQKALKEIQEIRDKLDLNQKKSNREFLENEKTENIEVSESNNKIQESELTFSQWAEFDRLNSVMDEYTDRFETDEPDIDSTDDLDISDDDLGFSDTDDDMDIDEEPDRDDNDEMDMDSDDDFGR